MGIESQNLAAWYEGGCKFRVKHWYELGADADTDAGAGWGAAPEKRAPAEGPTLSGTEAAKPVLRYPRRTDALIQLYAARRLGQKVLLSSTGNSGTSG